ncbi:purple acid phosphatase family protein [Mobilicoccus massiliensis]|uniref:purple acid phosphatase family protein n=1 Tax=Mobilicoccus massiliensis TaxID=1522310 RepID=UPI00069453A3|nr:metallophosphoesterase family protein [Mobilicoccus massiliensis]
MTASTPPVRGLHLQFGADAAREVVVSWWTPDPVTAPRCTIRTRDGAATTHAASTRSYADARSGRTVHAHHVSFTGLEPATRYEFVAEHDGAAPEHGDWLTGPAGRAALSFTAFGDQGVPMDPVEAERLGLPGVGGGLGAPEAAGATAGVESLRPLFHVPAGDLAYANLAPDRVETWARYFDHTSTSARHRPWMPVPGNHENEHGNGRFGYDAYRTFYALPHASGHTDDTRGLWYAFTAGSVRIVGIHTDDFAIQHAGDDVIHDYSRGAQLAWLREELGTTRADPDIDWVIVVGHQLCISTADRANGADLGLRRVLLPLCAEFDVDLVIGGHDHHYERSHPVLGGADNETCTPVVAATRLDEIDATAGTVHLLVGSGGTSAPTHERMTTPPRCRVITDVTLTDDRWGRRLPVHVWEDAPWSASRNLAHPFGFVQVTVDPGDRPGGLTRLTVTFHEVHDAAGTLREFETFTLVRPRSDAPTSGSAARRLPARAPA